jgi:hydroxypyruvate reductase
MIASGPTVVDQSGYKEVEEILKRYDLFGYIPDQVLTHLQAESGAVESWEGQVHNLLVGSNLLAARAAAASGTALGLEAEILTTELEGEAQEVGIELADLLRRMAETGQPVGRPGVLIAGGETTVTLQGSGIGGRNQELALSAVEKLAGLENTVLVTLATDGGDGSSKGAGAVVTGETSARAGAMGMDPADYLANNDSDAFFRALGDQVVTGPTQTNVNDLVFLFVF